MKLFITLFIMMLTLNLTSFAYDTTIVLASKESVISDLNQLNKMLNEDIKNLQFKDYKNTNLIKQQRERIKVLEAEINLANKATKPDSLTQSDNDGDEQTKSPPVSFLKEWIGIIIFSTVFVILLAILVKLKIKK
jgi:ABC-type multidrug transport system fused ATPase/permease subunit